MNADELLDSPSHGGATVSVQQRRVPYRDEPFEQVLTGSGIRCLIEVNGPERGLSGPSFSIVPRPALYRGAGPGTIALRPVPQPRVNRGAAIKPPRSLLRAVPSVLERPGVDAPSGDHFEYGPLYTEVYEPSGECFRRLPS